MRAIAGPRNPVDAGAAPRLPDFVVIGVMKSGTTTLFRWLDEHPDVRMPRSKEPNFFSDDRRWQRGIDWYASLFDEIPRALRTGEASVAYTDPEHAPITVSRLCKVLPRARLVCLLRDPAARLRSHYRHEVLRGRERRPLPEAVRDRSSPYVQRSLYTDVLRPWLESDAATRLHVLSCEELFTDDTAWGELLCHLGLEAITQPATRHNATGEKDAFALPMRMLWDSGLVERMPRPPRLLRSAARRVLLRPRSSLHVLDDSADGPLAPWLRDLFDEQVAETSRLLGRSFPAWGPAR